MNRFFSYYYYYYFLLSFFSRINLSFKYKEKADDPASGINDFWNAYFGVDFRVYNLEDNK